MRILITNDDGIHAPGLAVLERIARTLSEDVWVVAPETDQSGLAHSLTLNDPLRLRQVSDRTFALRGTPTDCVIMAVRRVMQEGRPDLVLSGVNAGRNAGDDVTYSGTVAGAIEGTLLGIPSIALSQSFLSVEGKRVIPWETAEAHAPSIIDRLVGHGAPRGVLYNVNFPRCAAEAVTGVRVTAQGIAGHGLAVDERLDGRGNPYFWLKPQRVAEAFSEGTDMHALSEDAISVSPLRVDMTAYDQTAALDALFAQS